MSRLWVGAGLDFLHTVVALAIWLRGRLGGGGSGRAALGNSREKQKDCHIVII